MLLRTWRVILDTPMPDSRARAMRYLARKLRNQAGVELSMKTADEQLAELEELVEFCRGKRAFAEDNDAAKLGNVEVAAQRTIALIREGKAKEAREQPAKPVDDDALDEQALEWLRKRGKIPTLGGSCARRVTR